MVLYVIGLGLADEHDITLKGFEAVKSSERIYLESYTSILMVPGFKERLEKLYRLTRPPMLRQDGAARHHSIRPP